MHSFQELSKQFSEKFQTKHFPYQPEGLYEPAEYFLGIGGKRIRPIACLMANELFGDIESDTWQIANALELFHNFTLLHDDIMDEASLRRGKQTVHLRNGQNTAILSGDVMLIRAYEYLNELNPEILPIIFKLFNKTAKEVCEGQQYDMEFERRENVSLDEYINMIKLKTSVLLAASLEMGAIVGGATRNNCDRLYGFGKNLGIAFQIQDDYLDCFGNPEKFGKEVGGDIRRNKKTFLLIKAKEMVSGTQKAQLERLLENDEEDKVGKVLSIYKDCGIDEWAKQLQKQYADKAFQHLEDVVVINARKKSLRDLAEYLLQRDY
ncbi:polyprenyl synthetase family protein [Arachidicoccus soli]|uniref:Polyprenyl synthetase family protein n=1 Tax=Arachidicoccus soli TaxID=2341117 RepID=A0A386HMY7_9BACT|nr:polyprenyl synthetase family protein [Arachidicoccus soli]AYD46999.1 polyprenyl synthetase family protein [Arachidicoccus soli]